MALRPLALQDVAEALRRLPPDVVVARNCRLRRALDLSMKKEVLPKELQAKQTPDEHYLAVRSHGMRAAASICRRSLATHVYLTMLEAAECRGHPCDHRMRTAPQRLCLFPALARSLELLKCLTPEDHPA